MSTINLSVEEGTGSEYPKFFKGGLVVSSIVLVIILCVYGGLLYANKRIAAQIQSVSAQYTDEYNKFLVGNANEVIDFRNRSSVAEKLISQDKTAKEFFDQLESSLLPTVHLSSLAYDHDTSTLDLSCVTTGFNVEAKQILSFQENSAIASVVVGKSAIDPATGAIDFAISLKMK